MSARRRALGVVLVLALVVSGTVPALAGDVDFGAVSRVTFGLTNQGGLGGMCSSGLLNFSRSTGPGVVIGTLLSGTDFLCNGDGASTPISGGALTLFTANSSVVGTIGDESIVAGQALPNGFGILALEALGPESVIGNGFGYSAFIERHNTTFAQSNLTGTWRVKGITAEQGPGGFTEVYFGSIVINATGGVLGGALTFVPSHAETIVGGNITVSSSGQLAGFVQTDDGGILKLTDVLAFMAPDKNFVAGVTVDSSSLDVAAAPRQGMFFLQREPTGTAFTQTDLAGTWQVLSLQGVSNDSSQGLPFFGTVTFDAAGRVTASNLTSPFGPLPPVTQGQFLVDAQGFVSGGTVFGGDVAGLEAVATMFKEKNHIIGVNEFVDTGSTTFGLFTMFKQGPPPPASIVQFSTGNFTVQEGMPATLPVTRSGATTTNVTVDYTILDPLADGPVTGTLTFPPGMTSRPLSVSTIGNDTPDADHVITVLLSNPTNGATVGPRSSASLLVLNDDATFAFSNNSYTVSEAAGRATITVFRSGALAFPASVAFTTLPGTAVAGKDFTQVSGTVSFAKGVTVGTFTVPVSNNSTLDGDRTVVVQLLPPALLAFRPAGARPAALAVGPTATLTIRDDDTPGVVRLGSASLTGTEGASVTVNIVRAPKVPGGLLGGNVSVDYATANNASAIGGQDYAITTGTVTFTGTETMKSVMIPLTKDNIAEGPESFLFGISNPTNGAELGSPSTARINITDLDRGGVVSLSASSYTVSEGAGNVSITVKRTGGTAANVSVRFTTNRGTATDGVDYDDVNTTVVFGLNETTKTVVIPVFQDTEAEGNETFTVTLGNPLGGATLGTPFTATVTIVDDESAIRFTQAAFDAREGTPGKLTVVRSGALGTTALVPYNISSISAFKGVDFDAPLSGTLTFAPNVSQQFIMIPTIDNSRVDGNRSVLVTLGTPTGGAQLASPSSASFTIVDDDQPGIFRMGAASYTVTEGGAVMVDIMRMPAPGNAGPLAGNISISYATMNGNASAGADFTPVSGTVVFGPLETKRSIPVQTLPDTIVEGPENFFFVLSGPTGGATLGSPAMSTVLIRDDDSAGVVFLSQSSYRVGEGGGNISITVMRTGGTANASVQFTTVPGSATDGAGAPRPFPGVPVVEGGSADYGLVDTRLEFGAGEMRKTVVIPIFQDTLAEGDEVFTVVLSNPQGGLRLGTPSSAPVTITDDEVVIQFSGAFMNNKPVVVRTGPKTANVSVQFVASNGTADISRRLVLQSPGTIVFPPGVDAVPIPLTVVNDNIAQGPETFSITLMNPTAPARLGPSSSQLFTIFDNDFGGTVGFGNTSPTATLGQTKPMTIVRSRDGLGTVMTVSWAAIGGTAVPGVDFAPASGQATFQLDQTVQSTSVTISSAPSAVGKTIVFGLTVPGGGSAKLAPGANTSTLTIVGGGGAPSGLELISQSSSGTRGNGDSARPMVSNDGRYVAFISASNNLATGAGEGVGVYVRDRQSGTTELVSVTPTGAPENGDAMAVAISGDGRYVAFVSDSSNLVSGDGNGLADVFLRDRVAGTTVKISTGAEGSDANGASIDVAISADGNVIAFTSFATNLGAGGPAETANLYVFTRSTGTIELSGNVGAPAPPAAVFNTIAGGRSPALSADGRFLAFLADGLLSPGTQAYVMDRTLGTLEMVSQNDGAPSDGSFVAAPAITADGRFVAFESNAANLGEDTSVPQVYVYDRMTGSIETASRRAGGAPGNGPSTGPSFSADGRFVGFVSAATNLVTGDTNAQSDVFVQDRATGDIRRLNVLTGGTQADGATDTAVLSATGTFAAFATAATSLSSGDFNESLDVLGVVVTIPPLPTADIVITNVVNVPGPALNTSVTFTVSAKNNGPGAASSVQVTDLLPAGYAFVSATPSQGSYASATGVWTVGSLANGATATLTLTAIVLPGGPYLTTATRTGSSPNDPNAANDSATASITPQAIVLTTDGPLVGIGRMINGLITIPSPAPAGFIVTMSASPAGVVTVPPIVAFAAGATTAPFTITGVAVGTTTITGSAAGLASGTAVVTTTSSVISLGALANLGPGQNLSLPISLSVAAPPGGVTVSFTSGNTSIATVTPSVFIPGGSQVPAANPQVTGVAVGSSAITASATGFAPDTRTANVVVNASFTPSPFSVVVGTSKNITVNISAPAPAGGLTFALATGNSSIATVATAVTVAAGQTSVQASVTGAVIGSTTLQATGAGVTSTSVTVNVTVPPTLTVINQTIGKDLQVSAVVSLGAAAPAGGLAVTLRSNTSSVALSSSATAAGSGTLVTTVPAGSSSASFFIQALANSSAGTITASATGYQNGSSTVTLVPSAFIINNPGNFTTTTLSGNTSIQITSARLTPGTLAFSQNQALRGGIGPVNVNVTATDDSGGPNVGAITASPLIFNGGDSSKSTTFDPNNAGGSVIRVLTPAGFGTAANFVSVVANVSAPKLFLQSPTIGKDLQVSTSVSLETAAPSGGVSVTLSSVDPSRLLLSNNQSAAGTGTLVVVVPAGASSAGFLMQALDFTGSVGVNASAAGYQNGSSTVTLVPSGFIINNPGNFTTTTLAGNTGIQITSARLTPGTLTFGQNQALRGGIGPVNVEVTATDDSGGPNVGAITASPLTFNGGDSSKSTSFDPDNAGGSVIRVLTPAGFDTAANFAAITANVSAPKLFLQSPTIGKDLQVSTSVTLETAAPTGGLSVTLTSSDASKLVLSNNQSAGGGGSLVVIVPAGSASTSFFMQALDSVGSANVSAVASSYQGALATVGLVPSGFIINNPGNFSTTTFSGSTAVQITSARLAPGTLNFAQNQALRGGIGPVNVALTATDLSGGPGVGTITPSSLTFNGGDSSKTAVFDPAAAGTSLIEVVTPAGFSTSNNFRAIAATVTAPSITINNVTVGRDLQTAVFISLPVAPPSAITVTLTAAATTVATLSRNQSAAGTSTVTFSNVTSTSVGTVYVQGRTFPGTTTITVQAPGYNDGLSTVTTQPSGFIINSPGDFTTTAGGGNTTIQVGAARLDPTTMNFAQLQEIRGGLSVPVPVTSTTPSVGAITTSPVTLGSGSSVATTQFDPAAVGTTQITVGVPAGFDTPSNFRQVTVTVNP